MIDAIVLAGSSKHTLLQENCQVSNEALIPIGNKMMVEYVVEALKGSAGLGRIIIAGPVRELAGFYSDEPRISLVAQGPTQVATLLNGLEMLQPAPGQRVLVATSDIPLLTTEAIDDFLEYCSSKERDLFYPIVPKEVNEKYYPGVKRTYIPLKDGVFTGGNLFLVNTSVVRRCAAKAEELVRLRKSPFGLSRQIGIVFILKFLLRLLSLREVEIKFSNLLGIKGEGVISRYPEVGIDVDKPSDLALVRRILAG
ncbi:MAG TPA: NTP transferase domain-containing protein [Clostridia bacterium]|nr:NTP transferase domain-containing protein [Clostridia bacterium]